MAPRPSATRRLTGAACITAALLGAGCATNPVTGREELVLMSEDQEIAIGRKAHGEILDRFGRYDDAALQAFVQRVGERVAARSHRPELIYRFTVLDSAEVNAFALPGGYVYVTRGLLAYLDREAELAAVLGHEVGHVTARHSVRQYTAEQATGIGFAIGSILFPQLRTEAARSAYSLLGTALLRGYGREHELEADRLGAEYLARAGYDPDAMLSVLGVLKSQERFEIERARRESREPRVYHGVFATHPDNDTRLQEVVGLARRLARGAPETPAERESFLRRLDGLVFGSAVREGVVRGHRFFHRDLDIAIDFPPGWRIENRPDRLIAVPPANDALLQVTVEDRNRRLTPREFMRRRLGLDRLESEDRVFAGESPAHTALAWTTTPYGRRPVRVTVVFLGDKAYVFAGARKAPDERHRYRTEFLNTALSLRRLDDDERPLAEPNRIRLRRAAHERYEDLARDSPLGVYALDILRLINRDYPDGEPRPGTLVKVVE